MSLAENIDKLKQGIYALSFYSPLIIVIAVMYWGITVNSGIKSAIYLAMVTFVSLIRWGGFKYSNKSPINTSEVLSECSKMMIPEDPTYSVYIISFTLFYLLVPMILVSNATHTSLYNFGVISFFSAFMIYDIIVKSTINCIDTTGAAFIFSLLAGSCLGAGLGSLFYTSARSFVFINENQTDKEVCNMPTKQQFKCRLYKNGQLVTN